MYTIIDLCLLCLTNKKELQCISSQDCDGILIEKKKICVLFEVVNIEPEVVKHICTACLKYLDSLYHFKQRCIQNINTLNNYIHILKSEEESYTNLQVTLIDIKKLKFNQVSSESSACKTIKTKTNNLDYVSSKIEPNENESIITDNVNSNIEDTIAEYDKEDVTDNVDDKIEHELQNGNIEEANNYKEVFKRDKYEDITDNFDLLIDDDAVVKYEFLDGIIEKVDNNEEILIIKDQMIKCSKEEKLKMQEHVSEIGYENITVIEQNTLQDKLKKTAQFYKEIMRKEINDLEDLTDNADTSLDDDIENLLQDYVIVKDYENISNKKQKENVLNEKEDTFFLNHALRDDLGPSAEHKCSLCAESFKKRVNLRAHIRVLHKQLYKCDVCGKLCSSTSSLGYHKTTHGRTVELTCSLCEESFQTSGNLRAHKRVLHKQLYKCDVCGKLCSSQSGLRIHKTTHGEERPFKCDVCGKLFKHKCPLKRHKILHTNLKPYACKLCGKNFDQPSFLESHKLIHNNSTFKCETCNKIYTQKRKLRIHKQRFGH